MAHTVYKEGQGIWARGIMASTVFVVAVYAGFRVYDWLLMEPGAMWNIFQHRMTVPFLGWVLDTRLIPVAILLIFLTPLMMLLGYLAVAETAGRHILRGRIASAPSLAMTIATGVLALEGILLIARLLNLVGSVFDLLGFILGVVGWSIITIVVTMGFGGFLMTRFRAEKEPFLDAGAPPPPPPAAPAPPAGF